MHPDKIRALAHYTDQAAQARQPEAGDPCRVRWATPDGGTQWCAGQFIAMVPAIDTEYRVLARSKTPRGGTTLVEAHPDSVSFLREVAPCN